MAFAGFCIGGTDWFRPELAGLEDAADRSRARRAGVADEALLTHGLGGNMMRVFFAVASIAGDLHRFEIALGASSPIPPQGDDLPDSGIGLHRADTAQRIERLDRCDATLDELLTLIAAERDGTPTLDFSSVDDVVGGVEDANAQLADPGAVRLLLTLVATPPRWIVEAPSSATLAARDRPYTFASLWEKYLQVNEQVHRLLVRRYAGRPVAAYELGNEPDYVWTPEDQKIEFATDPTLYPLSKYVTELQLAQVPETEQAAPPVQAAPWGFEAQDGEWQARAPRKTPVTSFDWGPKFDWYVRTFAQFQERLGRAVLDEAKDAGVELEVISASVTHNNIDYLLRMHRAEPHAFDPVTKIGIHPYHWVRNDVWDAQFVDSAPTGGWTDASPREFASDFYKRFDFLEELARCVRGKAGGARRRDLRAFSRSLAGKGIWITEFGIGTKVMGAFNAPIADYTRFIRPRDGVGLAAGHGAAVWEDLWEAFADQVDGAYLEHNSVDALLLYSLREIGVAGLDMDDDDRSNMALLHRDGSPRMQQHTLDRVHALLASVTGAAGPEAPAPASPAAALQRRPWRERGLSPEVLEATTMLSIEERQLLAWLAESYWRGEGAIVDGGCFLGGSTLALAEGLRAHPQAPAGARIDVYDLFETEPYMVDLYFPGTGLQAGDSFRGEFDKATAAVADLLEVHDGDLAQLGWDGRPIEVLFVDFAKSWSLNDVVVREFFPRLIPDRSIVLQQDYAFAFQPWIAITMEHLRDCFEPVAFAEYNTVAFACRAPVPGDVTLPSELPRDTQLELFEAALRRFRGYPLSYLEAGKAMLLLEQGDVGAAQSQLSEVRERYAGDALAQRSAALVQDAIDAQVR